MENLFVEKQPFIFMLNLNTIVNEEYIPQEGNQHQHWHRTIFYESL